MDGSWVSSDRADAESELPSFLVAEPGVSLLRARSAGAPSPTDPSEVPSKLAKARRYGSNLTRRFGRRATGIAVAGDSDDSRREISPLGSIWVGSPLTSLDRRPRDVERNFMLFGWPRPSRRKADISAKDATDPLAIEERTPIRAWDCFSPQLSWPKAFQ
jgi:hypothetical protein